MPVADHVIDHAIHELVTVVTVLRNLESLCGDRRVAQQLHRQQERLMRIRERLVCGVQDQSQQQPEGV